MTTKDYGLEPIGSGLEKKENYTIGVIGGGDVGRNLLLGLRLLGGDILTKICFYERSEAQAKRILHELGIIRTVSRDFPPLSFQEDLSKSDVIAFTASAGVPPLGEEKIGDVRLLQMGANARILKEWVQRLESSGFTGVYLIVSDPVDFLCRYASAELGIAPERIVGFGQGVMYARAAQYGGEQVHIYGPHGSGLWVANDPSNYDRELSLALTKKTREENILVRGLGFKPFIAPAFCSGALSILDFLRGKTHYACHAYRGIHWGELYHPAQSGWRIDRIHDEVLFEDVKATFERCREEYGEINDCKE